MTIKSRVERQELRLYCDTQIKVDVFDSNMDVIDIVDGEIKNITAYGFFIELDLNLDTVENRIGFELKAGPYTYKFICEVKWKDNKGIGVKWTHKTEPNARPYNHEDFEGTIDRTGPMYLPQAGDSIRKVIEDNRWQG